MKRVLLETLYVVLQVVALLLWLPFRLVAWVGYQVSSGAKWAGDVLVLPLYWDVVQAKRQAFGLPRWRSHDVLLGIGPPCHLCGQFVPPDAHGMGCRTLSPEDLQHLAEEARRTATTAATAAPPEEERLSALRAYAWAVHRSGADLGRNDAVDLGALLSATAEDTARTASALGHPVLWEKASRDCLRLAEEMRLLTEATRGEHES